LTSPVLLGGYASKSCARKTHNTYDMTVPRQPERIPEGLQRLFAAGKAHEADVYAKWMKLHPDVVDLSDLDNQPGHAEATVQQMRAGRAVIVGGRLPDDAAGGRTGKPDVLLFEPANRGYYPCDVKAHKIVNKDGKNGLMSTLRVPAFADAAVRREGLRHKPDDLFQLAHYWRMLEAVGLQAPEPWGAIIGTDDEDVPSLGWYDLSEPRFKTYSSNKENDYKAVRSSLERYDHEHAFRRKVAETARARTGRPDDPEPLVEPLGQEECLSCRWAPVCVQTLPADDATAHLRDALSVREYLALRRRGITTLAELADMDVGAMLNEETGYGRENIDQTRRVQRLHNAHLAAVLARDGVVLRLKPDARFDVPTATVEIDLDMESAPDGIVYLWGALVTVDGRSNYQPFGDPTITDAEGERRTLLECLDWMRATHPDAVVFHYAHVERSKAVKILGEELPEYAGSVANPTSWFDLLPPTQGCLDSRKGYGLKVVATVGAGFEWRDKSPGGLESQAWLEQARAGSQDAWDRILDYNTDDVRATLELRRWLRRETDTDTAANSRNAMTSPGA